MGAISPDLLLLSIELLFLILSLLNFGLKVLTLITKFSLLLISLHLLEDCLLIFLLLILKWLGDLAFTLEILILKNPWIFEFSFLKLNRLKNFLRLIELILCYAITVIQLLPLLKFFIVPMALSSLKVHLHKLKTPYFLKPYFTIWLFNLFWNLLSMPLIYQIFLFFHILILIFTLFFYTFFNYQKRKWIIFLFSNW